MAELDQWTAAWSNPVFSLAERDARWGKVRGLMARDGIDVIVCLPCTNAHGRGQANARYLTQLGENSDEATVAFPIDGDVTAWHSRGGVWPSSNWFTDIRAVPRGMGGATVTAWLKENPHYQNATIAIAGLDTSHLIHVRAGEGEANWQSVEILKRNFPGASFVSATNILGEARFRKSSEEIDFLRKATVVAEKTLAAVSSNGRPGVAERDIYAHMMFANAHAGGGFQPMVGWYSGPNGRAYHRIEQPTSRILDAGDALHIETEGRWGGYIVQLDQTYAVGAPLPDQEGAMALANEAFNRALAITRPGTLIRDIIAAATMEGLGGRARTKFHGHGRGTGDDGPVAGTGRAEPDEVLNLALEEGCCMAFKPSTIYDGIPNYACWGDAVIVTATGAERLGTRAQELPILA